MCVFSQTDKLSLRCFLEVLMEDMKPWRTVVRQLFAEFLGTLLLVVIGCGSTTTGWSEDYQPTTLQVALTFGITVTCIVQMLGHVSGAHVNPAVTLAVVVGGLLGPLKALLYMVAQCVGAATGSILLQAITPNETVATLGVTALNPYVTPVQGYFVEMLITFVLGMAVYSAIFCAARGAAAAGPFTIGISVTACHLFAMQYTGASMNPARSFGPALVTGSWKNHWVYWLGPSFGGIGAGIVYKFLRLYEPHDAAEHRRSPGRAPNEGSGIAEGAL